MFVKKNALQKKKISFSKCHHSNVKIELFIYSLNEILFKTKIGKKSKFWHKKNHIWNKQQETFFFWIKLLLFTVVVTVVNLSSFVYYYHCCHMCVCVCVCVDKQNCFGKKQTKIKNTKKKNYHFCFLKIPVYYR